MIDIPYIGFTGPRNLPEQYKPLIENVIDSTIANKRGVTTGCANGADAYVREFAQDAIVFKASSFVNVPHKARYITRSIAMVRFVLSTGNHSGLVGFVGNECPNGIVPSRTWKKGNPLSGTWSTLALGLGLGLPIVVFWCNADKPILPNWVGGEWLQVRGNWSKGWKWHKQQQRLI